MSTATTSTPSQSNVIYLGRLPDGFNEDEMRRFLDQFGEIKNLRISRNKKSGHSRHYAFVQFKDPEVAAIVADTLNDYILFKHRLSCHVVAPENIHEKMFYGANKKPTDLHTLEKHKESVNKKKTPEQVEKSVKSLISKQEKKRLKLKELGIDYSFEGYKLPTEEKKEEPKVVTPKKVSSPKKTVTPKKTTPKKVAKTNEKSKQ
ncbi:hypothetical protein WA158_006518 [Blastocystis sp. Blastoise]